MATYTVKKGDNLVEIAKKYNVSTSAILDANPGVRSVGAGVSLRIPTLTSEPTLMRGRYGVPTPQPPTRPPVIPPTTYVPPPPEGGYGPSGYVGPKEGYFGEVPSPPKPTGPGGRRDITPQPPVRPPYVPPPTAPPLEPSRPGAPAPRPQAVAPPTYTGPYAPTQPTYTSPYAPRAQQPGFGGGLIPGALRVAEQIAPFLPTTERVTGILDRIFRRTQLTPEQPSPFVRRPGEPTAGARWPVQAPPQGLEPSRAGGVPSPTTFDQFVAQGLSPEQARVATIQAGLRPDVGVPEYDPVSGFPVFEGGETPRRSSIIEYYLDNGILPFTLWAEDVARFGWTDAELTAAGYIEDAYGNWIRVGMEPTGAEVAGAGGGGAGGYGYPAYGYPQYVYPEYGGGGGGGYTYPQSFVGREGTPYPQSFVQRGQRGVSPTGRSTRPARFGAVSWRI